MQQHQKGQEHRRMLVEIPAEQGRDDHRVAQRADRKKFGRTLEDGDEDRVEIGHDRPSATVFGPRGIEPPRAAGCGYTVPSCRGKSV
jgi:hypothetical protein